MRLVLTLGFLLAIGWCNGQVLTEEERFISRLIVHDRPPTDLLSTRTIVLFSSDYSQKELEEIQRRFQQIGIDAISYVESQRALAGFDLRNMYNRYFVKRDTKYLLFIRRDKNEYQFYFVLFRAGAQWSGSNQAAWYIHSPTLGGLLQSVFYSVAGTQKRQNFLVNDFPERKDPPANWIGGTTDGWAPAIRYQRVAIPKTGDSTINNELSEYLKDNFPGKYELVESTAEDKALLQSGFVYVLRSIHATGTVAKSILGYDMSKSESALATVSYLNGSLQLKTIPSGTTIYKYYLRNIEDNVLYPGPKWDADITWQEALKNFFDGYRAAGKLQ